MRTSSLLSNKNLYLSELLLRQQQGDFSILDVLKEDSNDPIIENGAQKIVANNNDFPNSAEQSQNGLIAESPDILQNALQLSSLDFTDEKFQLVNPLTLEPIMIDPVIMPNNDGTNTVPDSLPSPMDPGSTLPAHEIYSPVISDRENYGKVIEKSGNNISYPLTLSSFNTD